MAHLHSDTSMTGSCSNTLPCKNRIISLSSLFDQAKPATDVHKTGMREKGIKMMKLSFYELDPIFFSSQPENTQHLRKGKTYKGEYKSRKNRTKWLEIT